MPYERPDLAPYAAKSHLSRGRRYPEEFKDERPAFERDKDRIIHSASFRRLMYKTQVFLIHEGDYYRTRLTHSLEVAQIARGLARMLGLNEELTEAIALAHDLGHTPFGHAGEEVLDKLMEPWGGFEHNLQSLRVVELLEERYPNFPGLNLTYETREGLAKHSKRFHPELEEYNPEEAPTLEAQLIEVADEIAYNNHDIDDGLKSNLLNLEELEEIPLWKEMWDKVKQKYPYAKTKQLIYSTISHLISFLMHDVAEETKRRIRERHIETMHEVRLYGHKVVDYSPEVQRAKDELMRFLFRKLYCHYRVERMKAKAEKMLQELFNAYLQNPKLLPEKYQLRMERELPQRVICDYIAGMTDRFAIEEYKRLFDPDWRV
jgi:dGTPase